MVKNMLLFYISELEDKWKNATYLSFTAISLFSPTELSNIVACHEGRNSGSSGSPARGGGCAEVSALKQVLTPENLRQNR